MATREGVKGVKHAGFWRFADCISPFHDGSTLYLISTLNWFDSVSLQLQEGEYLFDNETKGQFCEEEGSKHIREKAWLRI